MNDKEIKVTLPDGSEVQGVPVEFEASSKWSEFKLEDGTVLRTKFDLVSAARLVGKFDDHGNPLYHLQTAPVVALINAPKSLQKPKDE